jgi:hypothetical protein
MTEPLKPAEPVAKPVVEPKPVVDKEREKERGELLTKIGNILKEYDNKESDIPLNHEYWGLLNRHRGL